MTRRAVRSVRSVWPALALAGALAGAAACGDDDGVTPAADAGPSAGADAAPGPDAPTPADAAPPDADLPPSPANLGWIGGACDGPSDCEITDGFCLVDGFPNGMCTLECDGFCPDRGEPGDTVSFCTDGRPFGFDRGLCVARCDTDVLPGTGCPAGYRCVPRNRYIDPRVVVDVCVPVGPPDPCGLSGDELIPVPYPDRGMLWIPAEAQCGGAFDLVVMLHGINPDSTVAPSLGGGRHLEILVRSLIDAGLIKPLLLAEPVQFSGSSTTLYGDAWDPGEHLDLLLAELDDRGVTLGSLSYIGHSGAGCDLDNGLYKILTERDVLIPAYAPSMPLWGLEDVCYWPDPMQSLAGTGTALFNMHTTQDDPTELISVLFPDPVDLSCSDALYTGCIRSNTEPWCSYDTRATAGIVHDNNPYFFVREALPQVFSPDPTVHPCR